MPGEPAPREAAWALLATGLHVHRWFLLVQPELDRREREAVERCPAAAGALAELCGRLPQAAIEHLLDPRQPPGWWDRRPFDPPVARLCGRQVAVVDGARCEPPVVPAARLLHGLPALDQGCLDVVSAMLEAAGVAQAVQLGVQMIVVQGGRGLDAGPAPGPRTALVTPAPPDGLAEQLLAAAARTWVRLLLDPATARQPVRPPDPGAEERAVEGHALSLRYHLLTRLAEPGPWPEAVAVAARERLPEIRAEAARFAGVVHDLAACLGRLALGDLLTLTCPGPRQFEKYRRGKVAGQA